jgi:hypothetical protein
LPHENSFISAFVAKAVKHFIHLHLDEAISNTDEFKPPRCGKTVSFSSLFGTEGSKE